MELLLVVGCLAVVIGAYFYNNPMHHGHRFMWRRFTNWFPLGMTYAFLYMGRYNLAVSKNAMGPLMSNQDFGWIFACGTWTYALCFLVNGPLVDRIGGKKGILIAAVHDDSCRTLARAAAQIGFHPQFRFETHVGRSVCSSACHAGEHTAPTLPALGDRQRNVGRGIERRVRPGVERGGRLRQRAGRTVPGQRVLVALEFGAAAGRREDMDRPSRDGGLAAHVDAIRRDDEAVGVREHRGIGVLARAVPDKAGIVRRGLGDG